MLLLTDFSDAPRCTLHAPYCSRRPATQGSWDARRAFGGVTKHVMQAHDPIAAVQATQLGIKHALSGQPGPVAILYSHDSLAGTVAPDSQPMLYRTRHYLPTLPPPAEQRQVEAAATAILSAQKPVLIAGNGVRIAQAYDPLRRLAEAAGSPGGDDGGGQGLLRRDPSAGLGSVRYIQRYRGGQRLHRRSRSGAGRRLQNVAERHCLGEPYAARPGPPNLCADRHRAAQCFVELPG